MAGYLEKRSDGYIVLHYEHGGLVINKVFEEVHIPVTQVSTTTDHEKGFRLYIPDPDENDFPEIVKLGWVENNEH